MENQNPPEEQNTPMAQTSTQDNSSRNKLIIAGVVAIVVFLLFKSFIFSPERAAERMLERAGGGDYNVSLDKDGGYEMTNSDGESVSVKAGGKAQIPDNWPSSLPIPSGANVEYSAVIGGQDGENIYTLNYSIDNSVDEIANIYKDAFSTNGWKIEAQVTTSDGSMVSASQVEGTAASVYISTDNDKTAVVVSLQTK